MERYITAVGFGVRHVYKFAHENDRLGSRLVLDATETQYRSMEKGTNVLALVSAGSTPSAPIHGRSDKLTIKDS